MEQAIPIYLQISQYLENEILSGNLQTDDKVPSTNDFSKMMKINPATAGKGLNQLVDQGILYKRRGMGMYVTLEARDIILQQRKSAFQKLVLPDVIQRAKQLGISPDELIEMIRSEFDA